MQARARLHLPPVTMGTAPCHHDGCRSAVGVPVWMWTDAGAWTPKTASAAAGPVRVTVTGRITRVAWDMGDGTTVDCATPGTPRHPGDPFGASPDCGYRYEHTSRDQPDGAYTVTATAYYRVTYTGSYTGTEVTTVPAQVRIRIGEVQTIIKSTS